MDIVLCCFRFVVANVRIIVDTSSMSTKISTRRYAFLTFREVFDGAQNNERENCGNHRFYVKFTQNSLSFIRND